MINLLRKKFPGNWYYDSHDHSWFDRQLGRRVRACAALAPRYDGDDDTFTTEYWMYYCTPGAVPTRVWLWFDEPGHDCAEGTGCICSTSALEPEQDCPVHGYPFPPRCHICGRFMKWEKQNVNF
jgi:hypothetical protein